LEVSSVAEQKKPVVKKKSSSSQKQARQALQRRTRNIAVKTRIRSLVKKVSGLKEGTKEALPSIYSEIDRAVQKGVLHKRTAARKKSRLARRLAKQG
jgi:small subunit ribosomal protein S20